MAAGSDLLDSEKYFLSSSSSEDSREHAMLHSASAFCLLLVAVSSNLAIAIKKEKRPPQTLSRGWGDDITWVQTYEEGLFHIQKSNKPLMVILHLEDCQYCQALKKVFAQNEEIQEMAQNNFIMLNLMHETMDKNLSPDGQYVPRIMFVDPSLTVRADITGRYSNRLYTYEPQDLPILIENMKKALKLIQSEL
ncbi:anterior gradient protein 3 [Molossus nigricans]